MQVVTVLLTGQEWILCRCSAGGEWVAGNGSKSGLHEVFMGCKERGKPAYLARLTAACI